MGCELRRVVNVEEFSFNKMLSRTSSVGTCSSRIYYYRSASEGIPFQWEMQPGTPKDQPKEEAIPPLSPPPAILSLGLPKPCINIEEPKPRSRLKLKFWRKLISKGRKTLQAKKIGQAKREDQNSDGFASDYKDERLDFYCSDCEFMASSRRDSSSNSSLSSLSFSNALSRQSSRLRSPAWHPPNRSTSSCSPWNISSILVSLAKHVGK